jgi:hypothetical protein
LQTDRFLSLFLDYFLCFLNRILHLHTWIFLNK